MNIPLMVPSDGRTLITTASDPNLSTTDYGPLTTDLPVYKPIAKKPLNAFKISGPKKSATAATKPRTITRA